MFLNNNDRAYNRLLGHKINQRVDNQQLRHELNHRIYDTNSIVEDFECFVCQRTLELPSGQSYEGKNSQGSHYENCGPSYPKMAKIPAEHRSWQSTFNMGSCEASLLHDSVLQNEIIDRGRYESELLNRYETGVCNDKEWKSTEELIVTVCIYFFLALWSYTNGEINWLIGMWQMC